MAEPGPLGEGTVAVAVSAIFATITQGFIWLRFRSKVRKEEATRESNEEAEVTLARMKIDDNQQERFIDYLRVELEKMRVDLHEVVLERDSLQARNSALAANYARLSANNDILKAVLQANSITPPRLVPIRSEPAEIENGNTA